MYFNPMVTTPGMLTFSHDALHILASPWQHQYMESTELKEIEQNIKVIWPAKITGHFHMTSADPAGGNKIV